MQKTKKAVHEIRGGGGCGVLSRVCFKSGSEEWSSSFASPKFWLDFELLCGGRCKFKIERRCSLVDREFKQRSLSKSALWALERLSAAQ